MLSDAFHDYCEDIHRCIDVKIKERYIPGTWAAWARGTTRRGCTCPGPDTTAATPTAARAATASSSSTATPAPPSPLAAGWAASTRGTTATPGTGTPRSCGAPRTRCRPPCRGDQVTIPLGFQLQFLFQLCVILVALFVCRCSLRVSDNALSYLATVECVPHLFSLSVMWRRYFAGTVRPKLFSAEKFHILCCQIILRPSPRG